MKIYWGWRNVPELAALSRRERCRVVRDCFLRFGFRLWQFWVGQLAILIFAVLGETVGILLRDSFGLSEAVESACGWVGLVIGCLVYSLFYFSVVMDRLRPHFRDYIAQRKAHAQPPVSP
jgi:hypothetical protein